jgi:hypothetical protein
MTRFISFVAALLFAPALAFADAELGKTAPDFAATDIEGHAQGVARYQGKIVVLEWNNPGCPFVHKHYDSKNMQALQADAAKKGVVWLTINSSATGKQGAMEIGEAQKYVKEQGAVPTSYILDSKGVIGHLYGASATPHMFVIDAAGNVAYMGAIDDNNSANAADALTAHNYVKAAYDALLAGKTPETTSTSAYGCSVKYAD